MKRILTVFLSLVLFAFFLAVAAVTAAGESRDYLIFSEDGSYVLTRVTQADSERIFVSESLSEILTALTREGGTPRAVLDSVEVRGDIALPVGAYVLSGSLSVSGSLTAPSGCDALFSSLNLSFNGDGFLRIKGGRVRAESVLISGGGASAVMLTSPESCFELLSGEISGSFESAAVVVKYGSLAVTGGRLENSGGAAIITECGMSLSGVPEICGAAYGIKSAGAISLTDGARQFSGSLTLLYDGRFLPGTLTEIFYNASPESISGIRVLDADGKEYALDYFDESKHVAEKKFAAVYLPYSLKYFTDGELFYEDKLLSGETPTLKALPERVGFTSLGWYTSDGDVPYIPIPVTSELALHSRYELNAPTFSISSLSFTYDGELHRLSFDTLWHPLLDSGAFLTYEWKRGNSVVSTASSLSVSSVSDSGDYSVTLTLHYGDFSSTVILEKIGVKIEPAAVPIPKIAAMAYTGSRIYASPIPSSLYSFSEVFGIGAGSYPVTVTLSDSENYRWEGEDGATVTVDFVIERAKNAWTELPRVSDSTVGTPSRVYGTPLFGEVIVEYSSSSVGPYGSAVPSEVGTYFARLSVAESPDYTGLYSEPLAFKITEDSLVSIRVEQYAARVDYTAFEHFSPDGLSVIATYKSGREERLSNEKIRISYNGRDSLRVGDRSVTLSYGGFSVTHPVEVSPAEYDLSGIVFSDTQAVFDGKYHTVSATLPEIVGLDGLKLKYEIKGGGTDAGSYGVTLVFSSDSKNYRMPDSRRATLTVLPLSVRLVWSNTDFTYDGGAKLPSAAFTDAFGVKRYATVTGERYSAGEGYVAAAEEYKNYTFINPECEFVIAKADYDLSGVYWSDSSFYYNGESHRVELFGLPSGVTVVGYTDATFSGAGIYTARATVTYDSENYNAPAPLTHEWVIYPAEYDISGFEFLDTEAVFDGNVHYPTLVGEMPTGLDGIRLSYSFSLGATHVAEGRVAVTVRFFSESKNYTAPSPKIAYVTVKPRGVTVSWQENEFTYDGKIKLPRAVCRECAVAVRGGFSDAGIYIARAESAEPDYYILNPEFEYEIKRAENSWTVTPSAADVYEGSGLSLVGESLAGTVEYKFFADIEMTEEILIPTLPGKYYAVAIAPETKNHLSISSPPIPFEIVAVVPTELLLTLTTVTQPALSPLSPDTLRAYLLYNNGERRAVAFSELDIVYESGEVLHYGDGEVRVSYLDFSVNLSVSVARIDYDLSSLRWQNTDSVYDGEVKCPTLTGLPSGVSVSFYEGYGTDAGEYTVRAHLSYDTQNYNPPKIEDATLVIRKCTVIPTLSAVIYDGRPHIPASDSPLYTVVSPVAVSAAGSYPVTLRLTDCKNYTFTSGDEMSIMFTVMPRVISLSAPDLLLYLFESVGELVISSPEGTLAGDEVEIIGKIEGERVIYRANNPNYALSVSEGRVTRVPYPSPSFTWTMLFVIIFILLVILGVLVVFYRYDDILAYLAAVRCKRRMRKVLAQPEKTVKMPENDAHVPENFAPDTSFAIDERRADELISDTLARSLIRRTGETVVTSGRGRAVINVDTLSESFEVGDKIDLNILKEKNLVPADTAYLKVLARGVIDKSLSVRANDFSLAAVKMLALSGGEAIKVATLKEKRNKES